MNDTFGDGWNGNIWNLTDQNGNLAASCTLDTGTNGVCEFTLGGLMSDNVVEPVEATDRAPENKHELVDYSSLVTGLNESNQSNQIFTRDILAYRVYKNGEFLIETDINTFSYTDTNTMHDCLLYTSPSPRD